MNLGYMFLALSQTFRAGALFRLQMCSVCVSIDAISLIRNNGAFFRRMFDVLLNYYITVRTTLRFLQMGFLLVVF